MQATLRLTADGSHTLYSSAFDEQYHSIHGAVQESAHIFIQAALRQCARQEISVFEVGFGTGLNAFLSFLETEKTDKTIHYTAVELFPVPFAQVAELNYAELFAQNKKTEFELLHKCAWNAEMQISDKFSLRKLNISFLELQQIPNFDVCFFDAFSPEKQPEMWTAERFAFLYKWANADAILTTYCAKGAVRRALQEAGFTVERLQGPKGKREIIRARKC
ncbi:MAG: tRNA (5-methylaminomethyl-2-thiouridine)(34)-methyltransferase MnmD [Paludibacter sp.]|jgi:tRNA U34 5-methylaminomethyl-2-thiouridine-forming methyltransferase MnmC|nr:tRNA (5-methylaminomethyl-2-thiouridine)(34)-methyltransferase MnmD [Paludibacter sp.]